MLYSQKAKQTYIYETFFDGDSHVFIFQYKIKMLQKLYNTRA